MVRGLSIFQAWFESFEREYTLIGGTAAKISMDEEGLPFRGTKDLDIVLHVEVLTAAFGQQFWKFLQAGGYEKTRFRRQSLVCIDSKNPGMRTSHTLWSCFLGSLMVLISRSQATSPPSRSINKCRASRRSCSTTITTSTFCRGVALSTECHRGWARTD